MTMTMCNQNDIENGIRKVLTDKGEDGLTIVEEEVQRIIDSAVRKLTFRFGATIATIIFLFGGWVTTIQLMMNDHDKQLQQGDRYTQEEHDVYSIEVDRRFNEVQSSILQLRTDYKEDITDIKNDVRYIRDRLGG